MLRTNPDNRLARSKTPPPSSPNRMFRQLNLLLFIVAVLYVPLNGHTQTITLSSKKLTLKQAFAQIKKQTNYVVIYNPEHTDKAATISIDVNKQPLETFIQTILEKQSLSYSFIGTTIIIARKAAEATGSITSVKPESEVTSRDISGVVTAQKSGAPLPGVTIMLSSSRKGTQTDERGRFLLRNAGEKDNITFTFIGYEPITMQVSKIEEELFVKMKITSNELDKAVVQAYGITSKRISTGSITKVTAEEIARQPVLNPLLALQGKVSGMTISPTSGISSAPVKIEIRGRNTISSAAGVSDPLYIIDGVPFTVLELKKFTSIPGVSPGIVQSGNSANGGQSPLFNINPNDIESIEILKDGNSTAIYGSRGANGVILITTKKAKGGKTAFSIQATHGLTTVTRFQDMMNTKDYLEMRREAFKNDGALPTITNAPDLLVWDTTRYTNWQRMFLTNGQYTSVNAGLSGGDARTSFSISANYSRQIELMSVSGSTQVKGFSASISHKSLNQKLDISLNFSYGYSRVDESGSSFRSFTIPPNAPARLDKNGKPNYDGWRASPSAPYPFRIGGESVVRTNTTISSFNLKYELIKGLSINVMTGFNDMQNSSFQTFPIISQDPLRNPTGSTAMGRTKNYNYTVSPGLSYSGFIGRGRLSLMAGSNLSITQTSGNTTNASGFTNDALLRNVNYASFVRIGEENSINKYTGVFGRINYNWNNKYIINVDMTRDGSSFFAPGKQFGNFGSGGLAWLATEEAWMKKFLPAWISLVKLQGSYGISGSSGGGAYMYLTQWKSLGANGQYLLDYQGVRPLAPAVPVNQQYHWASAKKLDLGATLGFLNDRISLGASWYLNRCDNQLIDMPTPVYSGFRSVLANSKANIQNTGLNIDLSTRLIQSKHFNWDLSFNLSKNWNKLIAYPGLEFTADRSKYKVGKSVYTLYLLHYLGVDPQTGEYSYEDYDKNGYVGGPGNRPLGSPGDDAYVEMNPNKGIFGGGSTSFIYKNFSLFMGFDFTQSVGPTPYLSVVPGSMSNLYIPAEMRNNRWRKPGDIAKYPRYSVLSFNTLEESDGAWTETTFFRLNNASFNYSFNQKFLKKAGLQGCSISLNVQNVFTLTKYEGLDPQVQNMSAVPTPRIITSKISLNF